MTLQIELIPAGRELMRRLADAPAKALTELCNNAGEIAETVKSVADTQLALYERNGATAPWTGYLIRWDGRIAGTCSFTGPPENGEVEIAYFTFPQYERRGIASEAARLLIAIAMSEPEITSVIAHTLPEPNASTRILQKHGFVRDGTAQDKDAGHVWRWRKIRVR